MKSIGDALVTERSPLVLHCDPEQMYCNTLAPDRNAFASFGNIFALYRIILLVRQVEIHASIGG
jgi:hypothetical protein